MITCRSFRSSLDHTNTEWLSIIEPMMGMRKIVERITNNGGEDATITVMARDRENDGVGKRG